MLSKTLRVHGSLEEWRQVGGVGLNGGAGKARDVSPSPAQPNLGQSTFILYTKVHIVALFEERVSHFIKVRKFRPREIVTYSNSSH